MTAATAGTKQKLATTLSAPQIRSAIAARYTPPDYLMIEEAPERPDRGGTKIDCLVVSTWRSRGYERDAIEIKVSMHDFRRELANPAKADWWWAHCHRFWIACPATIADKVKAELPETWGLYAVHLGANDKPTAIVKKKAPQHVPEELSWENSIGIIRAAANAGVRVIAEARMEGVARGRAEGTEAERRARAEAENVRTQLERFREETGLDFSLMGEWGREIAKAVNVARAWSTNPDRLAHRVEDSARMLNGMQAQLNELAATIRSLGEA